MQNVEHHEVPCSDKLNIQPQAVVSSEVASLWLPVISRLAHHMPYRNIYGVEPRRSILWVLFGDYLRAPDIDRTRSGVFDSRPLTADLADHSCSGAWGQATGERKYQNMTRCAGTACNSLLSRARVARQVGEGEMLVTGSPSKLTTGFSSAPRIG